jgi:hypothetical protein
MFGLATLMLKSGAGKTGAVITCVRVALPADEIVVELYVAVIV